MSTVAIIPARGGSKRIPRKNIKDFCGKPIIAYSIEAARKSEIFDEIVVSTDDDEIGDVARSLGAISFRRPVDLADDLTPTMPVIAHAIEWFQENRGPVTFVCCIYATVPFLETRFLRDGLALLESHPDADFAFSVTTYASSIFRSLKLNADGTMGMIWPENEMKRSQDLPEVLHDAGQFYWGRPESFSGEQGFFSARSYPVILPRILTQDIDTPEDWAAAEKIFQLLTKTDA